MVDQLPTFARAMVTVDQDTRKFPAAVSEEELEKKRKAETTIPPFYSRGIWQ